MGRGCREYRSPRASSPRENGMSSNQNKKPSPKGKPLSEKLREKDERKAAELAALEESSKDGAPSENDAIADDDAVGEDGTEEESLDEGREPDAQDGDEATGERDESEETDDEEGEEEHVAAALGYRRYVALGFISLGLFAGYVLSRALQDVWQELASQPKFVQAAPQLAAIPHEGELVSRTNLSLLIGMLVGGLIVLRYYRRDDVRSWANEVADEISKVKWPTRKEIGNYTVIVIAGSALLTGYLALLDRFWAFVTNLIYSTGA